MNALTAGLLLAGFAFSLLLPNPLEWVMTTAVVVFFLRKFFKPGEFPVGLMAFAIPLVEITTSLLNTGLSGLTLVEGFGPGGEKAYTLSILSFFAFMLGYLAWGGKSIFAFSFDDLKAALAEIPMKRLVFAHLLLHLLFAAIQGTFGYRSSLFQLVLHFHRFPLILLYVIGWKYALERRNGLLVLVVFIANLLMRLTGFFSEWKELLFLSLFVAIGVSKEFNARTLRRLAVFAGLGVVFVLTWQGVKMQYRQFLNGGARSQAIVVSGSEALERFGELVGEFWFGNANEATTGEVFESTLDRLGYLEFFAMTANRVPDELPHERGDLLLGNLSFALIPRFLNPDKGVKNDQWKVEYYANRPVSDHSSFSLGRYAEWYVDFGPMGMVVFAFFIGAIGARLARSFGQSDSPFIRLMDAAFLVLALQLWMSYQADEIKIYGQTFWGFVVYAVIGRRLIHWLVYKRAIKDTIALSKAGSVQNKTTSAHPD